MALVLGLRSATPETAPSLSTNLDRSSLVHSLFLANSRLSDTGIRLWETYASEYSLLLLCLPLKRDISVA